MQRAQRFLPVYRIADANRGSFRARLHRHDLRRARGDHGVKRAGALGLHHHQPRQFIDKAQLLQFAQPLADRRHVPQIPAGNHQIVGNTPIALLQDFEHDGFLAFQPERVQRIHQIQPELLGQLAQHLESLVEIVAHFDDHGAKLQRLGQLGRRDFSVGNEDHRFDPRARRVGGHGSGGIPSRCASRHAAAQHGGLRDARRHPQILEGTRRVIALMFDGQANAARPFPRAAHFHERRASFRKTHHLGAGGNKGQKLAEPPNAALVRNGRAGFALLPKLPKRGGIDAPENAWKIVLHVQQGAARRALMLFSVQRVAARAALFDTLEKGRGHRIWRLWSSSLHLAKRCPAV